MPKKIQPSDVELIRLSERVGARLKRLGLQLTIAESCTGGYIAKIVTDISGSSTWFTEGFVTYSNRAKTNRLAVSAAALRKHGAVSEPVVRAMASGALKAAGANLAIAVTGIAGPGGSVRGKPTGTVWFGWAQKRGRRVHVKVRRRRFLGNRDAVRRKTVLHALKGLMH